MKRGFFIFLSLVFISPARAEGIDFTRNKKCEKSDYLCGQCEPYAETALQEILKDDLGKKLSISTVLSHLVKKSELALGNKLIPILLGTSPSLMTADATHPKVIFEKPRIGMDHRLQYPKKIRRLFYPRNHAL